VSFDRTEHWGHARTAQPDSPGAACLLRPRGRLEEVSFDRTERWGHALVKDWPSPSPQDFVSLARGFVWLVQTVPIYLGYVQRAVCRIPPLRPAHALVTDWPSQTSRAGLGQSPTPPSLSRDGCAWAHPGPLCNAVDWPSLCPCPAALFVCLVQTVPIDHGYVQRAAGRIPPFRLAHALVKDWPSPSPQDFVSLARGFSRAAPRQPPNFRTHPIRAEPGRPEPAIRHASDTPPRFR